MAKAPKTRTNRNPAPRRTANQRGYNYRWQKARETYLNRPENVWCRECHKQGLLTKATVVDHIKPHRGDQALFWLVSNWQPLCAACHNRKTAKGE